MDDLDLVTLATFSLRHEAEIIRARLEAEGIRALVRADDEGGLNPGFFTEFGVRLEVRREDLGTARSVIEPVAQSSIRVFAHPDHIEAFLAHASFSRPQEGCGLLAFDRPDRIRFVYSLTNVDASAHRFTVDPAEHYRALQHAERHGWHIRGSFHSHPKGPAIPSAVDLESELDSEWLHVIVGRVGRETEVAAFHIRDRQVLEAELVVA